MKEIAAIDLLEKQFSDYYMASPNLNNEADFLKIKTKDDKLKELQYKTKTHDHENILKSPKCDNEYYKKKYKSLNKKRKY